MKNTDLNVESDESIKNKLAELNQMIGLWKTSSDHGINEDYINEYDRKQDIVSQNKREMAVVIVESLCLLSDQRSTILDVGAGTGYLTKLILAKHKNVHVTCLDLSPKMLDAAKVSLEQYMDRVSYVQGDFNSAEWSLGLASFDRIVSLEALHRLTDARTVDFFKEVLQKLVPGGCFLSGHPFRTPSEFITGLFDFGWCKYVHEKAKEINKEVSLEALREFKRLGRLARDRGVLTPFNRIPATKLTNILLELGFEGADILWRSYSTTVVTAYKRPIESR